MPKEPSERTMASFAGHPMETGPREYGARHVDGAADSSERTYAMLTHLSLLGWHFGLIVIPALVMWLVKRDESPFLDDHGKEALNFQISLLIYGVLGLVLTPACGIGVAVWAAAYVLGLVGMIMGAVAANKGEYFRYPACIRLV